MTNRPDLATANSAREHAARTRAAALIAVANGEIGVDAVVKSATTESGRPLLRITVKQLLLALPGWGTERTNRLVNHMNEVLDITGNAPTARKMTVSWLIDPRAGGRRFMAFCDGMKSKSDAPWPGFPFASKPMAVQVVNHD